MVHHSTLVETKAAFPSYEMTQKKCIQLVRYKPIYKVQGVIYPRLTT